jgi:putative endonuclease
MLDEATLVFVEVRYRSSEQFGGAAASVTWRKQRRLANAAQYLLLTRQELRRYPARFDVVAISAAPTRPSGVNKVDWIKNAFTV